MLDQLRDSWKAQPISDLLASVNVIHEKTLILQSQQKWLNHSRDESTDL